MSKEMLINVSQGEECRIALVEDGLLEELYMERASSSSHVGNIYKGRVTNVEPSIQAAFIDFGLGRNGFLHISDLMPSYFGRDGGDYQESVGRKMSRRDRPPIQRCLRRGDEIIVQIIKEGIGTKGPTLTTYLSIPGRILVMMPGMVQMGVSRKIEDDQERRRLRQILDSLKPPKDVGFIIRTAGVGKTKTEIQRDLTYLTRLWTNFVKKQNSGPGPMELYTEGDLVTRTVRDVFTSDIDRLIVDDKEVARRVKEVIKLANPRTKNKVELYDDPVPLFHKYGIEREIEKMYSRHVPLPSGGSLVIDSTEAIVAIDVNSGKFREHADAETTAFKTDMEAADEIPRQLRLRDLGGVIICDFIDLRFERHRRELENRLHANFAKDRAKTKVLRMSQFGIIELTRQRMRPSLKRSIYYDCPACKGAGLVKTPESLGLDVMRRLAIAANDARVARVELSVGPDAAFYLQNRKRSQIVQLEEHYKKGIIIRPDTHLALDEMKLDLFDAREAAVYIEELGMFPPMLATSGGGRHDNRRDRGGRNDQRRGRDDRGRRDRGGRSLPPPREEEADRDQHIEEAEDQVDRREQELDEAPVPAALPAPVSTEIVEGSVESQTVESEGESQLEPPADSQQPLDSESESETQTAPERNDYNEDEGNGRRRRRRRGRRGRGGRGRDDYDREAPRNQSQPAPQLPAPVQTAPESSSDAQPASNKPAFVDDGRPEPGNELNPPNRDNAQGNRRRGNRGGRGGGRGGQSRNDGGRGGQGRNRGGGGRNTSNRSSGNSGYPQGQRSQRHPSDSDDRPRRPEPQRPPEPPAPRAAEAPNVTRTGSADRHLVNDEPVGPQPPSRPRSYRDLDSIPDDYD